MTFPLVTRSRAVQSDASILEAVSRLTSRKLNRSSNVRMDVRASLSLLEGARSMRASVIIPAYNEEQNIAALLRRLVSEAGVDGVGDVVVDDIVVIASGCTDGTVACAEAMQRTSPHIRILVQEHREGKASAINMALPLLKNDNVVLVSGDVLPAPGTLTGLLRCLDDPEVGAVGGRPVPKNDPATFTGFAAHLLWRLHHVINEINPRSPKCGEMIVFRRRIGERWLVPAIPVDSAVDEISVQALIHQAGLRSHYNGDAIVHTWGPSTLGDWFAQRRRINAGHIVYGKIGYMPNTMKVRWIVRSFARDRQLRRRPLWTVAVIAIEGAARVAGRWDLSRGNNHTVWKVASTTKRSMEQVPDELRRASRTNGVSTNGAAMTEVAESDGRVAVGAAQDKSEVR